MSSTASPNAYGYIDTHAHVWTSDLARYPLADGFTPRDMMPASFTADELMSIARPAGVDRVVLIQMVFYGCDNAYMLHCLREQPVVFAGVALIDEAGADPGAEMLRLKEYGVRGVRISPPLRGAADWLDGPGMHAIWKCAAQNALVICPLVDAEDLPALDRMCGRYPETLVAIDHCARIGGDGLVRDDDLCRLCHMARHPKTHVKLSAFYYLGRKTPPYTDLAPMIERLYQAFGPERLMWASDSPYQVQSPHTYAASLDLIRSRLPFLSAADQHWILRGTAERLFFSATC
jgi:predicted TIM-barrel fold metal-dependent hydrolase